MDSRIGRMGEALNTYNGVSGGRSRARKQHAPPHRPGRRSEVSGSVPRSGDSGPDDHDWTRSRTGRERRCPRSGSTPPMNSCPPLASSKRCGARRQPGSGQRCARITSHRGASVKGESGHAWTLARRRDAGDVAPVRRGDRSRAALPPGGDRPGDRHARRAVPRPVLGRARLGRGPERARDRRPVAGEGGPGRPAPRMRRRDPGPPPRRRGDPRRPRPGGPRAGVEPARRDTGPLRRRRRARRPRGPSPPGPTG